MVQSMDRGSTFEGDRSKEEIKVWRDLGFFFPFSINAFIRLYLPN